MTDRTQTLSVEKVLVAAERLDTKQRLSIGLTQGMIHAARTALSQPEHQGDEDWSREEELEAQLAEANEKLRRVDEARKDLIRDQQPPAPALSDEERERLEEIATTLGEETANANRQNDAAFLRSLASREHRGEEGQPYVCSECDHSIAPGAAHGRDCSRHPGNAYGALQGAVGRCSLAGITRDVMHQVVDNFSAGPEPPAGEVERLRERLLSEAGIASILSQIVGLDIGLDSDPDSAEGHDLHRALTATFDAVVSSLSDSQGDQERCTCGNWYYDAPCECEKPRCETCGGTGWKVVREDHDPVRRPCPDCNPAPTQVTDTPSQDDAPSVPDQFEGGAEEDWPAETYLVRDPRTNHVFAPLPGRLVAHKESPHHEVRRYVPASQDSSEEENQRRRADHLAWLLGHERDHRERAETALEELAEEFERRAGKAGEPASPIWPIWKRAALVASQKAAELKEGE